jgi:hypothetical protein
MLKSDLAMEDVDALDDCTKAYSREQMYRMRPDVESRGAAPKLERNASHL